jgi:hypothetical protein
MHRTSQNTTVINGTYDTLKPMLREFVSKARIGPTADLEAMTAERDFFREKYTEQMVVMEELRSELKESQRIIDRLRGRILDGDGGKASSSSGGLGGGGRGSANTSLTSYGDRSIGSSDVDRGSHRDDCTNEVAQGPVVVGDDGVVVAPRRNIDDSRVDESSADGERSEEEMEEKRGEENDSNDDAEDDDDDEADKIRANAERMLQWAQYQTSKRSTPNTSRNADEFNDDDGSESRRASIAGSRGVSDSMISSIPIRYDDDRRGSSRLDDDDDNSTLGSESAYHSERSVGRRRTMIDGSGDTTRTPRGVKIGRMFKNLRDMIDPPSTESESEGEASDDDDST